MEEIVAKYKYNYKDIKDLLVVDKELEIRAAYPEQKILRIENVIKVTFNSDSITPQKKQNKREEDNQEDIQIP